MQVHLNAIACRDIKLIHLQCPQFGRDLQEVFIFEFYQNIILVFLPYFFLQILNFRVDIDECEIKDHECDLNAGCSNTEGSYACDCYEPLFHGNGFDCHYHDPCYIQPCDEFSICVVDDEELDGFSCPCNIDTDGRINRMGDGRMSGPGCLCPVGYEPGIEDLCTDIDECKELTHDCYWKANCVNTEASFECVCKDGFQGDGYNCADIDECLGTEQ